MAKVSKLSLMSFTVFSVSIVPNVDANVPVTVSGVAENVLGQQLEATIAEQ
jgi:hypothetical protein